MEPPRYLWDRQEHQGIFQSTAANPDLHDELAAHNIDVSFYDGWSIVKGRFEYLCNFVGGIVSVFPSVSKVESKFLIVKAKKNEF